MDRSFVPCVNPSSAVRAQARIRKKAAATLIRGRRTPPPSRPATKPPSRRSPPHTTWPSPDRDANPTRCLWRRTARRGSATITTVSKRLGTGTPKHRGRIISIFARTFTIYRCFLQIIIAPQGHFEPFVALSLFYRLPCLHKRKGSFSFFGVSASTGCGQIYSCNRYNKVQ